MLVILEAHLRGIFYLKMVVFLQKKLVPITYGLCHKFSADDISTFNKLTELYKKEPVLIINLVRQLSGQNGLK